MLPKTSAQGVGSCVPLVASGKAERRCALDIKGSLLDF